MHKKETVKTSLQVKIKEVKKFNLLVASFCTPQTELNQKQKNTCNHSRKRTGHVELNHDFHASAAAVLHQLLHISMGIFLRIGVSAIPQPAYVRVWGKESNCDKKFRNSSTKKQIETHGQPQCTVKHKLTSRRSCSQKESSGCPRRASGARCTWHRTRHRWSAG